MADLNPNQSAIESLGPGQTLEQHYQELTALYRRRIKMDPKNLDHYVSLARVYIGTGDKGKALEILDGFEKRAKDSSGTGAAYGQLGYGWLGRDAEFAMELYRRAHELRPRNWYYLCGLGGAHSLVGQPDQAIARYTESTKLPGGANSINYFGLAMAHGARGQKDEAMRWYEKAMKQMPADRSSMSDGLLYVLDSAHSQASALLGIKTEEEKP